MRKRAPAAGGAGSRRVRVVGYGFVVGLWVPPPGLSPPTSARPCLQREPVSLWAPSLGPAPAGGRVVCGRVGQAQERASIRGVSALFRTARGVAAHVAARERCRSTPRGPAHVVDMALLRNYCAIHSFPSRSANRAFAAAAHVLLASFRGFRRAVWGGRGANRSALMRATRLHACCLEAGSLPEAVSGTWAPCEAEREREGSESQAGEDEMGAS